jgi:hypothetical protein
MVRVLFLRRGQSDAFGVGKNFQSVLSRRAEK